MPMRGVVSIDPDSMLADNDQSLAHEGYGRVRQKWRKQTKYGSVFQTELSKQYYLLFKENKFLAEDFTLPCLWQLRI